MKKLLIIGINTRSFVNSAFKLGYEVYSVSYYSTADFKKPANEKHILNQIPGKSCGFFEDNYDPKNLLELALEYMEEIDNIILTTGISPSDFKGKFKKYKKKIIGNKNIDAIEDKYKFYKKIRNNFLTPKTFKLDYEHIDEIVEILKQYENKTFIVKPLQGSGGYGVNYLNYNNENHLNNRYFTDQFSQYENDEFLIQEFIKGTNISSSVLSTKNQAKTIVQSRMLTENDFGIKNNFKYSGNIVPFNSLSSDLENNIDEISEDLISKFNLIGSNGVDIIIKNSNENNNIENNKDKSIDDVYIIEVNPRFQGTYECIEEISEINLLEAHINACEKKLIDITKIKNEKFSIKRILYTKERVEIGRLKIKNVYDVPYEGVIIEKDQPLATIITKNDDINKARNEVEIALNNINKNLKVIKN